MPGHYLDDVRVIETLSERLASLPLQVGSWDHVHKLLRYQAALHKRAFNLTMALG